MHHPQLFVCPRLGEWWAAQESVLVLDKEKADLVCTGFVFPIKFICRFFCPPTVSCIGLKLTSVVIWMHVHAPENSIGARYLSQ